MAGCIEVEQELEPRLAGWDVESWQRDGRREATQETCAEMMQPIPRHGERATHCVASVVDCQLRPAGILYDSALVYSWPSPTSTHHKAEIFELHLDRFFFFSLDQKARSSPRLSSRLATMYMLPSLSREMLPEQNPLSRKS